MTSIVRVLHVVTYMGRGGLETMIMNYYRHIDRTKVQFDFLVHRQFEADYDQEIISLGGKIYRLPNMNPFSKTYLNELELFFENHKEYRIVHSHLDCMAGVPLKVAKKHGVPVRIAHAHSSNQTKDIKYGLKLIFKQNIRKYATHLFACSREAGKWMFNTEDFEILNNAIDTNKYQFDSLIREEKRKEFGISESTLVVGHVGRFAEVKNHSFLLKIFAEMKKLTNNCALLLVGDGELREKIERESNELNLSNQVIFTGLRNDVSDLLQAIDVFVFPSLYEGLPVTIIESQCAGLQCVISNRVPIECKKTELVTQVDLEQSAEKWAEIVLEKALLPRCDASKEIVEAGFDIQKNADELQKFYLDLMK